MRITSSQLSYATAHSLISIDTVIDETIARPRISSPDVATDSRAAMQSLASDTVGLSGLASAYAAAGRDDLQDMDPKDRLAALAIEALVGHRLRWMRYRPTVAGGPPAASNGQAHQRTQIHSETEQTSVQAKGTVETGDGRTINFDATLTMQREQRSLTTTTGSGNSTDPLIVNFGGAPARLTSGKISFDLNGDGVPEDVSFAASGSGFLALDTNDDGKVNDGRELFGPQTGDGFAELAKYDSDGNGWIDEGDAVFTKLRIWTQNGLETLSQKGIGAIATTSAETPFTIKDADGRAQGEVRTTGVYLSENGSAGSVQQVDLS